MMKLANVSCGWTPIPEDMPEGDSLIKIADQIRGLGFEGVDYLGTPEALDEFFTEEACRTLGEHSRSIGLEPNVFVFQDDGWNACGSGDQARLSYAGRLLLSEGLGNLDGKLPQVPANRQKIWAADVGGVLPVFHGFHSSCDAQNAGGYQ